MAIVTYMPPVSLFGSRPAALAISFTSFHCRHRPADPDRGPAWPVRRRAKNAVLDFPSAVPIDRFAAPQRTGEPQAFEQTTHTLLERHAGGGEFRADVGDIGRNADAQNRATFCDLIEGSNLMCHEDGVAKRR